MRKKICFVIPTLGRGGMERVMSLLANYSVKQEYEVYIICLIEKDIKYSIEKEVTIFEPSFAYKKSFFHKIKVLLYLIARLKKISPQTILGFSEVFNPLSIVAARFLGIDVFISDRSNPLKKHSIMTNMLRKIIYPLANGIIAQTIFAKEIFLERKYNKNITVIYNPVKDFHKTKSLDTKKALVTVGRLIAIKNHKELINIFEKLNTPDWKLYIVGEGDLYNELLEYIHSLNLVNVILVGPTDDVDEWLEKADIFVYASLSEGFPNALSEAMAFPLACIAYDCPAGPSEIIRDSENGYLIPLNDTNRFTMKLRNLVDDVELRNKFTNNAIKIREELSIDTIGKKYLDFIIQNK